MSHTMILASENAFAKSVLVNAGLGIEVLAADLDDRALEAPLEETGSSPEDVASVLAEAKATVVSSRQPGALVLGCEQTLALDDQILHLVADMDEGRRRLLMLSGKTHQVNSAAVLVRDGIVVWRHVGVATLSMRKLDPRFMGGYLARVGASALDNPGLYRIDGLGIQLFESIEGDYFTIVGVPLMPLLAELRRLQAIDV